MEKVEHNLEFGVPCEDCAKSIVINAIRLAGHLDLRHLIAELITELAHAHPSEEVRAYLVFKSMAKALDQMADHLEDHISGAARRKFVDDAIEKAFAAVQIVDTENEDGGSSTGTDDNGLHLPACDG